MGLHFAKSKYNVTRARLIILGMNLLTSAAVLAYAGYSYNGTSERKETSVRASLETFKPAPGPDPAPSASMAGLVDVAAWLRPEHQDKAPVKDAPPEPAVTPPEPEEGPLGKLWEFAAYILWADPLRNRVMLRWKDGAAENRGPIAQRVGRVETPQTPRPRGGKPAAGFRGMRATSLAVWFQASEETCTAQDPTGGSGDVTFHVCSVSDNELVYSLPDKPGKEYRLPFRAGSRYLEKGRLVPVE